jgi:hypothetical protein
MLHFLSPLTCSFTVTAFQPDGTAFLRMMYDHRVMDGVAPAHAVAEVEACLNGEILKELHGMPAGPQAAC